ncbi:MAG: PLP-dependent aminotransferase family protein [Glaciimonas sp.]|nr:PLP-dependent aminotransferase family protein [Glaciimonas sp.]
MTNQAQRTTLTLDLAGIHLDKQQGRLSKQLYLVLRLRILATSTKYQLKLPTTRELALTLHVSRNTVVRAYEQLYAEGYLHSRVGDGTYADGLAEVLPLAKTNKTDRLLSSQSPPHSIMLARINNQINQNKRRIYAGLPRAFRLGIPAYDVFPQAIWSRLQASFWRHAPQTQMGYGEMGGDVQLRALVAAYLRNARGLACDPSQIIITAGAQHAISLCAQLLLDSGDHVAIENPGYSSAAQAFRMVGAQLQGIDVDADGLVTDQLNNHPQCRMAYVTPSHQYPLGVTLSLARRMALLAWAEAHKAWIVEDDYDGEYRYDGAPLAPLAALDRSERVLYVGTFSKITFPGLRLGYLVAPPALVQPLMQLQAMQGRHAASVDQAVMTEFIAAGHFQRHIRRMRRASRARRDALLAGWQPLFGERMPLPTIAAGLHVSVPLASIEEETALVENAATVGVEMNPLSRFCLPSLPPRTGLVLGFAAVNETAIQMALMALKRVWPSSRT